jgi:hypothetical protein
MISDYQDYPCQECPKPLGCIIIKNYTGWKCNKTFITNLEVCRIIDIIYEELHNIITDEKCNELIIEIVNNIRIRNDLQPITYEQAKKNNGNIKFND